MVKWLPVLIVTALANPAAAETRDVFLQDADGARIKVATLTLAENDSYTITMNDAAFSDHFLSMRPFKCLEGPAKHWCHVPYPYDINRSLSDDLIDLEYDLLFVWKGATEYGINMWNGVYYQLNTVDGKLLGTLHEIDMEGLAVPPGAGVMRPVRAQDLHPSDPDGHWLPYLIVE
ncbi:hypothetical protein [Yoonia sp. SS1-5]|uniref:Uncharacterized protein n=1 Tax=Yoonia rhodophyticola TaxID=3137370 RepID=A0AAN0NLI9_9RHOB